MSHAVYHMFNARMKGYKIDFVFQMFPVGLLNSIHRALEPHNDQAKGFTFIKFCSQLKYGRV